MKFNKICITGAPGVGKSTQIIKLKKENKKKSIHSQLNQTKEKLFPNKQFQELTENEIIQFSQQTIQNRINLEKKEKNIFSEGGIIYDFAWIIYFTKYLLKKEINLSQIYNLINQNIKLYNLYIYIPIQFEFISRNKPFESKESQIEIDKIIKQLLKEFKIKYLTLTGSENEKFNILKQIIK